MTTLAMTNLGAALDRTAEAHAAPYWVWPSEIGGMWAVKRRDEIVAAFRYREDALSFSASRNLELVKQRSRK